MTFIGISYKDRRLYIPKPATLHQMLAKFSQYFSLVEMSFIGISYKDRRLYIPKPATWYQMLAKVSQDFSLDDGQVSQLRVLYRPDLCDSSPLWELDHEAWAGVRDGSSLHFETVGADNQPQPPKRGRSVDTVIKRETPENEEEVNIDVNLNGRIIAMRVKLSTTPAHLLDSVYQREGISLHQQYTVLYEGVPMEDYKSLSYHKVMEGDRIDIAPALYGGKPAIYLMSPTALRDVTVTVRLRPEWNFTVLYPPTIKVTTTSGETAASWIVDVQPDGTMKDKSTGIECSYLFWEAASLLQPSNQSQLVPDAEAVNQTRMGGHEDPLDSFNPAQPQSFLEHSHEVLPFEQFIGRLDTVLKGLCLTVEMRTDFIVYWLPAFQRIQGRQQCIKFSFVPQDVFEKAAVIKFSGVEPPKTISRVFMLFSGVDPVLAKSNTHVDWVGHVGQNQEAMKDTEAFRVLEWGGMEVIRI